MGLAAALIGFLAAHSGYQRTPPLLAGSSQGLTSGRPGVGERDKPWEAALSWGSVPCGRSPRRRC
jgi:hypothetical protein